jgi:uncharacterized membrane protein/mono/diheme cytochrome c family protein
MATPGVCLHLSRPVVLCFLASLGARHLSAPTPAHAQADPSGSTQRPSARQPAPGAPESIVARGLFRQHCMECHGADGTGRRARGRLPEIPDFTDASWQSRRADAQLMDSILDGKGEEMPPSRGEIDDEQARGLVAYVRAFGPATREPEQADRPGAVNDGPAEGMPTRHFFGKLIRWLGRFHPPAVHFPIALLTAAAVAELLRVATGKPAFDGASRFCVWFGTLTAVVAGILGWFLARLRLTDAEWLMTTHRWLGTSTAVSAVILLILSERSRRPERRRTRTCFRAVLLFVTALVSVTGFFGGAVVFGLKHYAWPR